MAVSQPLQISLSIHSSTPKPHHQTPPPFLPLKRPSFSLSLSTHFKPTCTRTRTRTRFMIRATENGAQTENEPTEDTNPTTTEELSDVGAEIKRMMKEREKQGGVGGGGVGEFFNGVLEEIGEIEWPQFGKVVATTGVVLGVIAGSSVVLLTLNAVLAEVSDKVFAGKGVQDFFAG